MIASTWLAPAEPRCSGCRHGALEALPHAEDRVGFPIDFWIERLSTQQIEIFESALDASALVSMERMRRVDFPLRPLKEDIARWRREVQHGWGFVLLRGLPVESWGQERSERFFWGLGLHLGIPGAQNGDGDLLGHVRDVGKDYTDRNTRGYRTVARLAFHCDAADPVGLLCLAPAACGTESIVVSSVSVFNELLARRPDLIQRLFEPMYFDTRGDSDVDYFPIPPCRFFYGELRTFFHGDYFRTVDQYADLRTLDAETRELLDLYEEIAQSDELRLDMSLEPGDVHWSRTTRCCTRETPMSTIRRGSDTSCDCGSRSIGPHPGGRGPRRSTSRRCSSPSSRA